VPQLSGVLDTLESVISDLQALKQQHLTLQNEHDHEAASHEVQREVERLQREYQKLEEHAVADEMMKICEALESGEDWESLVDKDAQGSPLQPISTQISDLVEAAWRQDCMDRMNSRYMLIEPVGVFPCRFNWQL